MSVVSQEVCLLKEKDGCEYPRNLIWLSLTKDKHGLNECESKSSAASLSNHGAIYIIKR